MNKHATTFNETLAARCNERGFGSKTGTINIKELARRTGLKKDTLYRRLADGNWTRDQMRALDRRLRFTAEDMELYFREGTK